MAFTSTFFLIGLLPVYLIIYGLLHKNLIFRKILILIANSVFYIFSGIGTFIFVCCYTIVIKIFSSVIQKFKNKALLIFFCILSAIPLLAFKYTNFCINNINMLFSSHIQTVNLLIPLGISFFTFQAISCLADVYKTKLSKKISLLDTYLYLTFFPTVTSGPIMRIADFIDGFNNTLSVSSINAGIERIIIGLSKKLLIADRIGILANFYFDGISKGGSFSALGLWIGSIAYTLQLYFDFSGYSDIAIGIGTLLGFNIPKNFNKPYLAKNIRDFWQRWHITLSQWFRDYIYIPLGGSRCSVPRHIINLLVVWLLTGIWHGADWTFILWGLGYFLLLVAEKYIPFIKSIGKKWYGHLYTLFFVNLLWIPFRADNIVTTKKYLFGMVNFFGNNTLIEWKAIRFIPLILIAVILCLPFDRWFSKYQSAKWYEIIKGIVLLVLAGLIICAAVNASYSPYIYGNF